MNKALITGSVITFLYFGASLASSAQNAQTANGGFYKYKPGQLQKPAQSQMRPEIQLIRTDPIVKDFTHDDDPGPTYVIPLPAHKQGGGGNASGAPGLDGGESPYVGRPGMVILKPDRDGRILAPPGFESNMHALRPPAQGSLQGGSTVGVHGKMQTPPAGTAGNSANPSGKAQTANSPPTLAKYVTGSPTGSGSGADTHRTQVDVHGEVTSKGKRGELLNHSK
jgi:hypothetical protein